MLQRTDPVPNNQIRDAQSTLNFRATKILPSHFSPTLFMFASLPKKRSQSSIYPINGCFRQHKQSRPIILNSYKDSLNQLNSTRIGEEFISPAVRACSNFISKHRQSPLHNREEIRGTARYRIGSSPTGNSKMLKI